MRFDVVSMGEALIDFSAEKMNDDLAIRFMGYPGGGPANLIAAAASMGARCGFIGKVGNDFFGKYLEETLKGFSVDTRGMIFSDEHKTPLAFVNKKPSGENEYTFFRDPGADETIRKDEILCDMLESTSIFHFSSLAFTSESSREATLFAVDRAKKHGAIISYDPNWRPLLWKDFEYGLRSLRLGMPLADILKTSQEEAEILSGKTDEKEAADTLLAGGIRVLLVTKGDRGCSVYMPGNSVTIPAFKTECVDTTGAGDIFLGSFLAYILSDGRAHKDLSEDVVYRGVRFASAAAALSVRKSGGISAIPKKNEVDALISERKP